MLNLYSLYKYLVPVLDYYYSTPRAMNYTTYSLGHGQQLGINPGAPSSSDFLLSSSC
jgi:hypothetical protein